MKLELEKSHIRGEWQLEQQHKCDMYVEIENCTHSSFDRTDAQHNLYKFFNLCQSNLMSIFFILYLQM